MRKGFLASLALALGNTVAEAQYGPAPQPYYPAPNYAPVWVAQPAPGYHQNQAPRAVYPAAPQNYAPAHYAPQQFVPQQMMPQQMMPQQMMQQMPQQAMPQHVTQRHFTPQTYVQPNYLPNGYFPAPTTRSIPATTVVREGASTPVPPEPTPRAAASSVPARTVARPAVSSGPAAHFDLLPSSSAHAPKEPVRYHRECNDRGYVGLDYLMAWIRQGPLSTPLLTTGNPLDANPGAIGQPGTIVLFGNRNLDFRMFHGFRLNAGYFLDEDARFSVDASGFYMMPRHVRYSFRSDGSGLPTLGRPVANAAEGDEDVYTISFPIIDPASPVLILGQTNIDARTQILGGEVNGRWHNYTGRRLHTEALVGFRTLRLEETLRIHDDLLPVTEDSGLTFKGLSVAGGEVVSDEDRFLCYNQFYGFQVGGSARWEQDKFFLSVTGKVGMGVTDQRVRIEGESFLTSPAGNQTAVGGILAVPSNSGDHNRQVFGVVPEIGINVGVDMTRNLRMKAGYNFLLWNGVTRPGMQIDRSVNPSQVPTDQDFATVSGPPHPAFQFREQVFFLQTFNFGLEFHF